MQRPVLAKMQRHRLGSRVVLIVLLSMGCAPLLAQSDVLPTPPMLNWTFDLDKAAVPSQTKFTTQFAQPDFVPGVSGRAWRSDGFSSWVSAPLTLSPTTGFTVEGWVALESYPSGYEKPVDEQVSAWVKHRFAPIGGHSPYSAAR